MLYVCIIQTVGLKMSAIKSYLQEANELVSLHPKWSIDSLVSRFKKDMGCDQGTAVYFLEKAIENAPAYYDIEDEYDGI